MNISPRDALVIGLALLASGIPFADVTIVSVPCGYSSSPALTFQALAPAARWAHKENLLSQEGQKWLLRNTPFYWRSTDGLVGAMHHEAALFEAVRDEIHKAVMARSSGDLTQGWSAAIALLCEQQTVKDVRNIKAATQRLHEAGLISDSRVFMGRIFLVDPDDELWHFIPHKIIFTETQALGGLIGRVNGDLFCVLPRAGFETAEGLANLGHELFEMELLDAGWFRKDAHRQALLSRAEFLRHGESVSTRPILRQIRRLRSAFEKEGLLDGLVIAQSYKEPFPNLSAKEGAAESKSEKAARQLASKDAAIKGIPSFSRAIDAWNWVTALRRDDEGIFNRHALVVVMRALQLAGKLAPGQPTCLFAIPLVQWTLESYPDSMPRTVTDVMTTIRALGIKVSRRSAVHRVLVSLAQKGVVARGPSIGRELTFYKKLPNLPNADTRLQASPLSWQNKPITSLFSDTSFRSHGTRTILKKTLIEMVLIYQHLWQSNHREDPPRPRTPGTLLAEMGKTLEEIQTPDAVDQALRWLELKWFPLRHWRQSKNGEISTYWVIEGAAQKRFTDLSPVSMSDRDKTQWLALSHGPTEDLWRLDGHMVGERAHRRVLTLAHLFGIRRAEVPITPLSVGLKHGWRPFREGVDTTFEKRAKRFGIEASWILWGISRGEAYERVLTHLAGLSIGQRIQAFRSVAGLSRQTLHTYSGISYKTILLWESDIIVPTNHLLIHRLADILETQPGHFLLESNA